MLSSFRRDASAFLSGRHRRPKILCHVNHFFGKASALVGKSTVSAPEHRHQVVETALAGIRALPFDMTVRVCGFPEHALVPVNLDLSEIGEPRHIVYASIERMFEALDDYDFFLNIEDDVLVSDQVIEACIAFNSSSTLNEMYLPNRMERRADGSLYCVDLLAMPGWNEAFCRTYQDTILGVATNPHSALSFLSRDQMKYAAKRVDLSRRDILIAGYMVSAYANLHAPFILWRPRSNLLAHHVIHLDHWLQSPADETTSRAVPDAGLHQPERANHQPAGYVDAVVLEEAFVKVQGWAVTKTGRAAEEFLLEIDHHEITKQECHLRRIDRPDVVAVYPDAPQACGFELAFPVGTLFALQEGLDTARVTFGFRSESGDTSSIIQDDAIKQALQRLIAKLPKVPSGASMPEPVADRLVELMLQANSYLEYGTGGSTVKAVELNIPIVFAVESDALWLEAIRHRISQIVSTSKCHFVGVDIGPISDFGHPASEAHWRSYKGYALDVWGICDAESVAPDLILIDGRFRIACFLAGILFGKPGCRILINDYMTRPYYAMVEQFVVPARIIDHAAEFVIPHEVLRDPVWYALLAAVTDPR